MLRKMILKILVVLFCITFHSLNTQAGVFEKYSTKVLADSLISAIDRGDSILIESCIIIGPIIKEVPSGRTDTIKSFIAISQSTFSDEVYFINCHFNEGVFFIDDSLTKDVVFHTASFVREATFLLTTFGGVTRFSITNFGGPASFSYARFEGDAYFDDAAFDSSAFFVVASFGRGADFRHSKFGGDVDFSGSAFGGVALFVGAEFHGKANFSPKEFKDIDISWKQLKGHLVYDGTANYKLMKYFEEQRKLKDADGIFLFLKDQERMEKHPLIRYPEYWFIQLTCGYGRKPLNTFIFSILIVILFAVFFADSRAIKEIEPTASGKRFYNALYFSVHTFIIGIVSNWHPSDEFLIDRTIRIKLFKFRINKEIKCFKFRTLSMIEGALGWILVIILIISLERTIGR